MEDKWQTLKLLVTGASGLLGVKLCELAVADNLGVYSAYFQHKPAFGVPVPLNILDRNAVQRIIGRLRPEIVVHAAALTDVDRCETERELAWKTNVEATEFIVKSCRKNDAFMIYISTDYVFDGEQGRYREDDDTSPVNYYGLTKLKGEEFVERDLASYCIARTSVLYGLVPSTGKINFGLWLLRKLKNKEKIKIVTDQWNSPTLNENLAEMILEITNRRLTGVYHLAGATRISRYEFAKSIAETFGLDAGLVTPALSAEFSWAARRPHDSSLEVEKAMKTLANKPLEMKQALKEMKLKCTEKLDLTGSPCERSE